jgi:RNA polymerase sigma factor (sigma-70 family)
MNIPGHRSSSVSLCERIRKREAGAEAELVALYQRKTFVFANCRIRDRKLAEDAAQDILFSVISALREGRLQDPEILSSFVYAVARNRLTDRLRTIWLEKLDPMPEGLDRLAPAIDHEAQKRHESVEREIDRMDSTDRKILAMALADGLKPAEIAAAMKLSSDLVRERKSRALKKLTDRFRSGSRNSGGPRLIDPNS